MTISQISTETTGIDCVGVWVCATVVPMVILELDISKTPWKRVWTDQNSQITLSFTYLDSSSDGGSGTPPLNPIRRPLAKTYGSSLRPSEFQSDLRLIVDVKVCRDEIVSYDFGSCYLDGKPWMCIKEWLFQFLWTRWHEPDTFKASADSGLEGLKRNRLN